MSVAKVEDNRKVTTRRLIEMKQRGEKISMLTAYDYSMAKLIDQAGMDVILVGDSASNVMAGNVTTLPITLDQMVAACYANKSEFCRLFKATLHQTPFDFLLHYRIQQSLPLLCRPELTITEIATTVGFSGASYYSEVFRKYTSCSPTEYRKRILSGTQI